MNPTPEINIDTKIQIAHDSLLNLSGGLIMDGKVVEHMGRHKIDFRRNKIGGYITRDGLGNRFFCREHADEILTGIRREIREGTFDIGKYQKTGIKEWQFEYQYNIYINEGKSRKKKKKKWSPGRKKLVEKYYDLFYQPFFGLRDIRTIDDATLRDFSNFLPAKAKESYRNHITGTLAAFLNSYKIIKIKCLEFDFMEVPKRVRKWLSREDHDKVLDRIKPQDRPIYKFMMLHGTRICEARALMWDCVNFDRGIIHIKRSFSLETLTDIPKNNQEREIPLAESFIQVLRSLAGIGTSFVFKISTGKHYSDCMVRNTWNYAIAKTNVPHTPLKCACRHSAASLWHNNGADMRLIQKLLGHSDIHTTEIYTHSKQSSMAKVINFR